MKFSNKLLSLSVLLSSVAFADDTDSTLPSGTQQELTSHQKSALEELNAEINKLPLENRSQAVAVAINSGETNPILEKFNDAAAAVTDFVVENAYVIAGGVVIVFAVSGLTKKLVTTVPAEGFQKHVYNVVVFPADLVIGSVKLVGKGFTKVGNFVKDFGKAKDVEVTADVVTPDVTVEVNPNEAAE